MISSNSDSLVKVRAQVMTRDESTEGWLPLQGGGLANVSIRKRSRMADVGGHEYIIYGQRISDQTVRTLVTWYQRSFLNLELFFRVFRSFLAASSTEIFSTIKSCPLFITGERGSNEMVSHFKRQLMQELSTRESSKLMTIW